MASCPVYELELAVVPVLFLHLIPHAQAVRTKADMTMTMTMKILTIIAHPYSLAKPSLRRKSSISSQRKHINMPSASIRLLLQRVPRLPN